MRAMTAVAFLLAASWACAIRDESPAAPRATGTAFVLLADGRLHVVELASGAVDADLPLVPAPDQPVAGDHVMAPGTGADPHLYVLVAASTRQAVFDIYPPGRKVFATYELPDASVSYRSLAVGPRSGRLYVFGNRGKDVVLTILDAAERGPIVIDRVLRRSDGPTWRVYQGAVSEDEALLLVSYHGMDTSGVDVFAIAGDDFRPCAPPPRTTTLGVGCLRGHGSVEPYEGGLLVTTGEGPILSLSFEGAVRAEFDAGLEGVHLMEFALDRAAGRLLAVGSCGYAGGFARIDRRKGERFVLSRPPSASPCGERSVALGELLLVARRARPVPRLGVSGTLMLLDARDASVFRTFELASEPIDVAVMR